MLVLEQWLSGRDFARHDPQAAQMVNFVYFVGDSETRRAWLVDPAWDVEGLLAHVRAAGYELDGILLTHWHPDHAGGDLWGLEVEGAARARSLSGAPVHAHRDETPWLARSAGLAASEISTLADGDELALGTVRARCLHAPGHSPGSVCYLVWDESAPASAPRSLLTGDVLFVGACGRVDLPGSDPPEMHRTLSERLAALPPETMVLPGHDYGARPSSTLGEERRSNPYMRQGPLADWLSEMP